MWLLRSLKQIFLGGSMDFSAVIQLLNDLQNKIAELQLAIADADAFAKAQYDKGFADGVASVQVPDVQAQIDAAVALAVEPLNAQIELLNAKVNELQAQVDQIPNLVSEAVKAENDRVLAIVSNAEVVVNESLDKLSGAVREAALDLKSKIASA